MGFDVLIGLTVHVKINRSRVNDTHKRTSLRRLASSKSWGVEERVEDLLVMIGRWSLQFRVFV